MAPVLDTVLFALSHLFSPWRYPVIILGSIAWMARRERSVSVSIAAHMTTNTITVLLLLAALLAPAS
jgi:membrane protease YdiL (CAAX protease family)